MTNYTTADFTDIRGPEEKPTVPGWYVTHYTLEDTKMFMKYMDDCNPCWFDYWNGAAWEMNKYTPSAALLSPRYWFGLKEKP